MKEIGHTIRPFVPTIIHTGSDTLCLWEGEGILLLVHSVPTNLRDIEHHFRVELGTDYAICGAQYHITECNCISGCEVCELYVLRFFF